DWLTSELKYLEEIRKQTQQNKTDETGYSSVGGATTQGPSAGASQSGAHFDSQGPSTAGGSTLIPSFNSSPHSENRVGPDSNIQFGSKAGPRTVEFAPSRLQDGGSTQKPSFNSSPHSESRVSPDSNIQFGSKAGPRTAEFAPSRLQD